MKQTEEFFLINKQRNRIKRFRKFENISHKENDFIEIEYGFVFKSSSKPAYKGSRIESVEDARIEYQQLLKEGWKTTNLYKRNI